MADIREHMKIIGKDGAPVGTVDRVEGTRIKLTKKDNPSGHQDHHHYIDTQLVVRSKATPSNCLSLPPKP